MVSLNRLKPNFGFYRQSGISKTKLKSKHVLEEEIKDVSYQKGNWESLDCTFQIPNLVLEERKSLLTLIFAIIDTRNIESQVFNCVLKIRKRFKLINDKCLT